jgi:hypothetical protein
LPSRKLTSRRRQRPGQRIRLHKPRGDHRGSPAGLPQAQVCPALGDRAREALPRRHGDARIHPVGSGKRVVTGGGAGRRGCCRGLGGGAPEGPRAALWGAGPGSLAGPLEPDPWPDLATTRSPTPSWGSTLGAARFHGRVRNGVGWGPRAVVTRSGQGSAPKGPQRSEVGDQRSEIRDQMAPGEVAGAACSDLRALTLGSSPRAGYLSSARGFAACFALVLES